MKLSEHFDLTEFTTSQTASRKHIDNTPSALVTAHLKVTAGRLEAVREMLDHPLIISSGYRSPELNAAIGGVATSAHTKGWAADFICPGFGPPIEICRRIVQSGIEFDQLIEEGTWVHLSFDPQMRGQVLTLRMDGHYQEGLR